MRPKWTAHENAGSLAGGGTHNAGGAAGGTKLAKAASALQTGHPKCLPCSSDL